MKPTKIIILLSIIFISPLLSAEKSKTEFGVRIEMNDNAEYIGPDYKYFFKKNLSGEAFVLTDFDNGIEFYAFAEYIGFIPGVPENFSYYLGTGAHIGSWKGYKDSLVAGIDGIIGLQYNFDQIPISIALDWHPVFNILTDKEDRFWPLKFGLSVRYCF